MTAVQTDPPLLCSAYCFSPLFRPSPSVPTRGLLFAVIVFALWRLLCCLLLLYNCGLGRNIQYDRIGCYFPAPVLFSISTTCCAWPAFFDQFA